MAPAPTTSTWVRRHQLNAASGSTEVVHTYTGTTFEALLTNLYQRQFDLGQEDSERRCAAIGKQFNLVGPDGTACA